MNEQLTRSDIRTMARKAADYITFNCDGVSEGFEITHKGYTVFVDYSARLCNDELSEFTEVDRKSTRLNSSHTLASRMPSSA